MAVAVLAAIAAAIEAAGTLMSVLLCFAWMAVATSVRMAWGLVPLLSVLLDRAEDEALALALAAPKGAALTVVAELST